MRLLHITALSTVAAENSRITEYDPARRLRPRRAMSKRHEQRHASIWWRHTPKICASKLEVKGFTKSIFIPQGLDKLRDCGRISKG
jgi:hypothetical protein